MITLDQAIGQVRRWADYPLYVTLSAGRCAELLVQQSDLAFNDLNLSGKPWNDQMFTITVQPGEQYHTITEVGNFGTPWLVELFSPSNQSTAGQPGWNVAQPITITDPVNLDRYYNTPGGGPDLAWVAQACAFQQDPNNPGQWAVRFGPACASSATGGVQFQIHHFPQTQRPQSLTDPITLNPKFEQYLMTGALITGLPYCEWEGIAPTEAESKRQRLITSWSTEFQRMHEQFMRMRRQVNQGQELTRMIAFGRTLRRRR